MFEKFRIKKYKKLAIQMVFFGLQEEIAIYIKFGNKI